MDKEAYKALQTGVLRSRVPVGFRESVDHVRETLLGVADSQDQILSDPAPMVRFEEILDTHFHFTLIVWVKEPVTTMRVASNLRFAIAHAFAQRGSSSRRPSSSCVRPPTAVSTATFH